MAKHTPGEWRAHRLDAPGKCWDGVYEIRFNEDGECVAETVHNEADAHLIAAAPDLLAVCQAVLACDIRHDENGHAYLHVPARSLNDLGAQIRSVVFEATLPERVRS